MQDAGHETVKIHFGEYVKGGDGTRQRLLMAPFFERALEWTCTARTSSTWFMDAQYVIIFYFFLLLFYFYSVSLFLSFLVCILLMCVYLGIAFGCGFVCFVCCDCVWNGMGCIVYEMECNVYGMEWNGMMYRVWNAM